MRCGEDGTECAIRHLVRKLDGRCTKSRQVGTEIFPYEWAATCPVCKVPGKLTITAKGQSILRHCQRCKASQDVLTAALAEIFPGCFSAHVPVRRKPPMPTAEQLIALAKRELPGTAYRVAILRMVGVPAAEAQRILRIPKSTYYDAMKILGRESGFPDSAAGHG